MFVFVVVFFVCNWFGIVLVSAVLFDFCDCSVAVVVVCVFFWCMFACVLVCVGAFVF